MPRTRKSAANRLADNSFARAVKVRLGEKRLTLKKLALNMSVPEDRLRQWLYRKTFPEENLLNLCNQLGLSTTLAELEKLYGVQTTTHGRAKPGKLDVAQTIESVVTPRIPNSADDGFGADVVRFIRSMEDSEIFLVWAINEHPFEWTNVGWRAVGNALAWAILEKNIYCGYLHPSSGELNRLRDTCGIRNLPHVDFFVKAYDQFIKDLESIDEIRDANTGVVITEGHQKKRLSVEKVRQHVVRVQISSAAFCVPDVRFVLFIPPNPFGGKAPSALVKFPAGPKEPNLLLPLDENTTFDLYDYLVTAPKVLNEVPRESWSSPIVQLIARKELGAQQGPDNRAAGTE